MSRFVDPSHPAASDANPGTVDLPWKTLGQAATSAEAGQRIVIQTGTYRQGLDISVSGRPGSRIVFEAAPGSAVVLDGRCVSVRQQSHIEVRGLTIRNCTTTGDHVGIAVEGPGVTDIVLDGNRIDNTYGSAIGVWGVPYRRDPGDYRNITEIRITNNLIERANNGGYNEQITVANGVVDFEISGNTLRNSHNTVNGGEGIDVKEGASYGRIHHNTIHSIDRRAIYLDGGGTVPGFSSPVHHIDVYGNVAYDVPNGFAIMSEGGADVHDINVYNNVFYNVDHDCMFVHDHPNTADDPSIARFRNLSFINNTLYNCGRIESYRSGINMTTSKASSVVIRNNISWPRGIKAGGAETVDHNVTVDPLFVDPGRDFRLRPGSPAVDAGTPSGITSVDKDGRGRPLGDAYDAGAYEL